MPGHRVGEMTNCLNLQEKNQTLFHFRSFFVVLIILMMGCLTFFFKIWVKGFSGFYNGKTLADQFIEESQADDLFGLPFLPKSQM